MPALLFFRKGGKSPMTKIKKRATALLLGTVTFFMALAMPYHTTEVYAVDVGFTWVVNEYSNQILQWILLYLGISVAPEAISEGKVFDKTGEFAMDFCKEFFGDTFEQWYVSNGIGDDVDTLKKAVDDVLTTDWSSVGDAVASIPSYILDTIYQYLNSYDFYNYNDLSNLRDLSALSDVSFNLTFTGNYKSSGKEFTSKLADNLNKSYEILSCKKPLYCFAVATRTTSYTDISVVYVSKGEFSLYDGFQVDSRYDPGSGLRYLYAHSSSISAALTDISYVTDLPRLFFKEKIDLFSLLERIIDIPVIPNIDIPNVAGKDWAFDLVGWPNAWDIDKPDVKPWDGVDSLPIPGDVVLGDSIPGVIDFPDVIQKIIDGTIPWPDVIGAVRDIDIPAPDPGPDEPDKKPEPDPELPEIPAVLPQGVSDKLKDLSGKFPFCIPFDVVDCYKSFASKDNAEAPKWDIDFKVPGTNQQYHFSVDLAMFDKYIPIFRSGVLILFFIGLLLATRKLIGWQIDN